MLDRPSRRCQLLSWFGPFEGKVAGNNPTKTGVACPTSVNGSQLNPPMKLTGLLGGLSFKLSFGSDQFRSQVFRSTPGLLAGQTFRLNSKWLVNLDHALAFAVFLDMVRVLNPAKIPCAG